MQVAAMLLVAAVLHSHGECGGLSPQHIPRRLPPGPVLLVALRGGGPLPGAVSERPNECRVRRTDGRHTQLLRPSGAGARARETSAPPRVSSATDSPRNGVRGGDTCGGWGSRHGMQHSGREGQDGATGRWGGGWGVRNWVPPWAASAQKGWTGTGGRNGAAGRRGDGVARESASRWLVRVAPPVDGEGHITAAVKVIDRFQVVELLDRGTFGTVFRAWDPKWRQYVALKVVRKVQHYVQDAEFEVAILEQVANLDERSSYTVQLYKFFHYHGHLCIVTELLGDSLHTALKHHRARRSPITMSAIRVVAKQLLQALAFLKSIKLVHADLKAENILLGAPEMTLDMPEDRLRVKLIDFGGATWEHDAHPRVVQTRHYRSPEVVLGLAWSYPCDMWSLGCVLLELYEGKLTFDTRDSAQHLAMIQRLAGAGLPRHMLARVAPESEAGALVDPVNGRVLWPELARSKEEQAAVSNVGALSERIDARDGSFLALLKRMLDLDPDTRVTPQEALRSAFVCAG